MSSTPPYVETLPLPDILSPEEEAAQAAEFERRMANDRPEYYFPPYFIPPPPSPTAGRPEAVEVPSSTTDGPARQDPFLTPPSLSEDADSVVLTPLTPANPLPSPDTSLASDMWLSESEEEKEEEEEMGGGGGGGGDGGDEGGDGACVRMERIHRPSRPVIPEISLISSSDESEVEKEPISQAMKAMKVLSKTSPSPPRFYNGYEIPYDEDGAIKCFSQKAPRGDDEAMPALETPSSEDEVDFQSPQPSTSAAAFRGAIRNGSRIYGRAIGGPYTTPRPSYRDAATQTDFFDFRRRHLPRLAGSFPLGTWRPRRLFSASAEAEDEPLASVIEVDEGDGPLPPTLNSSGESVVSSSSATEPAVDTGAQSDTSWSSLDVEGIDI